MGRKPIVVLVLFLLSVTARNAGAETAETRELTITKAHETVLNGPYTQYLIDDSATLDLTGAEAAFAQGKFKTFDDLPSGAPEHMTGKVWFRFAVFNADHPVTDWIFNAYDGVSPEATLHVLDDQGTLLQSVPYGTLLPRAAKPIDERIITATLSLPRGEHRVVFLEVRNHTASGLGHLETPAAHYKLVTGMNVRLTAYFAVCLVMMVYNLFLYYSLRYVFYLEYLAFIGGMAFTMATNFAFGNYWLGPDFLPVHLAHAYRGVAFFTGVVFTRGFLRTRDLMPRVDMILKAEMWLAVVTTILNVTPYRVYFATVMDVLTLIFCFQAVALGIMSWRAGHRAALFYLTSWSGMVTCVVVWLLKTKGIGLRYTVYDQFLPLYGQMIEMIVISLGLGDHINMLIQDKKVAEVKAAEAEKQHVLLRVISEDLSRPLKIITDHAAHYSSVKQPLGSRPAWDSLMAATRTQMDIIEHVREMEAVFTGKRQAHLALVNLSKVVRELPKAVAQAATTKGISLIVTVPPEDLTVVAEQQSLERHILQAIVFNAIKFSPESATVRVTVSLRANQVLVEVTDYGIGMEPSLRDVLFDPFKRHSRLGTKGEHGIGFGMPIAKSYVNLFHGTIEVESWAIEKHPDHHGTTVRLLLNRPRVKSALSRGVAGAA